MEKPVSSPQLPTESAENLTSMREVSFEGIAYTRCGESLVAGMYAPDFSVIQWQNRLRVRVHLGHVLADGRPFLLSTSHTVDAPGSQMQLLRLEKLLAAFDGRTFGMHVSSDLPFTLNRCAKELHLLHIRGASDYFYRSFEEYGVLLEEPQVLCRSAFVIDRRGVIRYAEVPNCFSQELDYDAITAALKAVLSEPLDDAEIEELENRDEDDSAADQPEEKRNGVASEDSL
jgi:thiol peroxidase